LILFRGVRAAILREASRDRGQTGCGGSEFRRNIMRSRAQAAAETDSILFRGGRAAILCEANIKEV
jgi:hypothetical protein